MGVRALHGVPVGPRRWPMPGRFTSRPGGHKFIVERSKDRSAIEMAKSTADFLLERLAENGVKRIYGYPGDGINAIIGALERHKDIKFVQVRHEEQAAFMACAHAKFTEEVGVCMATSGPGAIHLLNGLYDAKLDHQPVLAVVGQQKRMSLGAEYQQEVDLQTLFADVSEFVNTCMEPAQARHLIDRAIRTALSVQG